jgi:hypothetical protein
MTTQRTGQLLDAGLSKYQLAKDGRTGVRISVRHGAWTGETPEGERARHRQLIAGTWPLLTDRAVLSHGSAAVLHGLPVWPDVLERVSVTRETGGNGMRTRHLHVRKAPLSPREVVHVDGYRVTGLERTAFDLARVLGYERGVAVLDAALHADADPALLAQLSAAAAHRRGAAAARRALAFADRRAESVGESISRVRLAELGLPVPELQFEVLDGGLWVARVDFAWPDYGVVGEFDGAVKYTGDAKTVAAAVLAEKHRQQDIEGAGWLVTRWTWSDLNRPERFGARLRAVLEQGRRLHPLDA